MDALPDIPSPLVHRLRSLRTGIRVRLVLFGVLAVLSGGIGAFLVIVALDWWLWLPGVLRIVTSILFFLGFVVATWHWIVKPLGTPLHIEAIAGRLERHFAQLTDQLTSAVEFVQSDDLGGNSLVRKVVHDTEQVIRGIRFEDALTYRPLLRSALAFLLSSALLSTVLLAFPSWAKTGWVRYLTPFGEIQWPRRVTIRPITQDTSVPLGESLSVEMSVTRGLHDDLRGVVKMRDEQGRVSVRAMRRDANGRFIATIDAITENLTCWFEAGDDSTRRIPFAILAVRRPTVLEATARITPPPYARNRPTRVHDLGADPVRAPIGGGVTVQVVSSKPVRGDGTEGCSALLVDDGPAIALGHVDDGHTHLSADTEIDRDLRFHIRLVDEAGFENQGEPQHVLVAIADHPPTVTIERPTALVELTPRGVLRWRVVVEDDYGVSSLTLNVWLPGAPEPLTVECTPHLVSTERSDRIHSSAEQDWDFSRYALTPGDVVTYQFVAIDNRKTATQSEQIGTSSTLRVKIISEVELAMRLRDEIAALERRTREALLEQTELKTLTQRQRHVVPDTEHAGRAAQEAAGLIGLSQERLRSRIHELATRFDGIAERMGRIGAGGAEAQARILDIGAKMLQTGDGSMSQAVQQLHRAGAEASTATRQTALAEAAGHQRTSEDELRRLIGLIAEWGNFRGLVTKTRDLIDRQRQLRSRTTTMGKGTLGKPIESLSREEADALARLQRRQEQLGSEFRQLLESMERIASGETEKNPSSLEASEAARRAAQASNVGKHLRQATEAIGENRSTAAAIEQKQVEKGLAKTLAALQQREKRELDRLRKKSSEAVVLVQQLIEDLTALRHATLEAGALAASRAAFSDLAERQGVLHANAMSIAEDLAAIERLMEAARMIRRVDDPLREARSRLADRSAEAAAALQQDAVDLLLKAHELLTQIEEEAEQAALQRTLDQVREGLVLMMSAQRIVNGQLADLVASVVKRGRVGRPDARAASKIARLEGDVRVSVNDMMPDLEEVVVFRWAMKRLMAWMEGIQASLVKRDIDERLTTKGDRIVRELEKLVKAIDDTLKMPQDDEFSEADGSSGGEGPRGITKPIPSVAELLVLKAMQLDINERTIALNESFDAAGASEAQLRVLTELGEDQSEVQRLAELVTQNAKP